MSVSEGIKQHYSLKVPLGGETQPWITHVVMSTLPADQLPNSLNKPGARRLCQVKSRLPVDMKLKNGKWYQKSDPYFKAEFDVQVLIGAADLRFQTLDARGVLSQDYNAIDVNWFPSPSPSQNPGLGINELNTEAPRLGGQSSPSLGSGSGSGSGAGSGPGAGSRASFRGGEKLLKRSPR